MSFIRKVFSWVRLNYKWVLGTFLIVSMVMCLYWFRNDLRERSITLKKLDILKKKRDIEVLREKKNILSEAGDVVQEDIDQIEARIKSNEVDIAKRRSEIIKLELNEKLDELDKMGY